MRIKVEDVVGVLKHHGVDVIEGDDKIMVWKGDTKSAFPLEEGFITKKFIQRIANKFGIPPHHFYHADFIRSD